MAAADIAEQHYQDQEGLGLAAVQAILRLWALVDPVSVIASLVASRLVEQIFVFLSMAQATSAQRGAQMVADVAEDYGIEPPEAPVDPLAFAGIASDGRDLETLLLSPVVSTLQAQRRGTPPIQSMAVGADTLAMIVETQVADAGRVASQVAITTTRGLTRYVRMLELPSCSRCAILAGRIYRWSEGFERHPRCDCVHIPLSEDDGDDLRTDPTAYFRSLSRADQDRVFTAAGAEAIRLGADIRQVVNARRNAAGLSKAGRLTPDEQKALRGGRKRGHLERVDVFGQKVFVTGEGVTTRGVAGRALGASGSNSERSGGRRRAKTPRLMPESIIELANGDRGEAVRLLTRFGYIAA